MATTKVVNDLIDLNQTGNTTALKGCKGTTAQQPGKTGQPAAVEGMLRTNTSLTSNGSASAMQFYKNTGFSMTSGWVVLTNDKLPSVSYLVIAGGGAGNRGYSGGGGAGGYRTNYGGTSFPITKGTSYTVTVGAGGTTASNLGAGANSTFASITSSGGGGGGGDVPTYGNTGWMIGKSGGSGGGSGYSGAPAGGSGNSGGYTPVEGYDGGAGNESGSASGGGGGGAGAVGSSKNTRPGVGGAGIFSDITGVNTQRGGGGTGAAIWYVDSDFAGGAGGGGGGASYYFNYTGSAGVDGKGGGGGGGIDATQGQNFSGGSGTVILRYDPSFTINIDTGNLVTSTLNGIVTGGTDKYTEFTGGTGTIKIN